MVFLSGFAYAKYFRFLPTQKYHTMPEERVEQYHMPVDGTYAKKTFFTTNYEHKLEKELIQVSTKKVFGQEYFSG